MSEALVREKTASVFGGMFRQISALAIGIPLLRKKSESTLGLYRVMVPLVAEMDTSQTFRIQGRHEVLRRNPVAPANLVDLSLLHAVPQEGRNRDQYGWFSPIQLILPFAGSLV